MMNTVRRIRWKIIFFVSQSNRIPRAEGGFPSKRERRVSFHYFNYGTPSKIYFFFLLTRRRSTAAIFAVSSLCVRSHRYIKTPRASVHDDYSDRAAGCTLFDYTSPYHTTFPLSPTLGRVRLNKEDAKEIIFKQPVWFNPCKSYCIHIMFFFLLLQHGLNLTVCSTSSSSIVTRLLRPSVSPTCVDQRNDKSRSRSLYLVPRSSSSKRLSIYACIY